MKEVESGFTSNKSIVVLPFVNMSTDPENEYFSDGITEEIINALTRVDGLKVIARTSSFAYKGKNIDIRTIGKKLGVSTVLEGSVRKSSQRVRITAQLIRTDDATHIWSENFDRELSDIFIVQDEISLLIADKIRENFGHLTITDHLVDAPTEDLDAYNLYLKARFLHLKWAEVPLQQAIQLYKASIEKDPTFALPYFGLAYCFTLIGAWGGKPELLQMAHDFAKKGMAIDKESFLGHFVMGAIKYWKDWDYQGGAELYEKAIRLNPHFTEGYDGMAEIMINIGRFDEALHYIDKSLALSPNSANHFYTKGAIYFYAKQYEEALLWFHKSLAVDSTFPHPKIKIPLCYIQLNDEEKLNGFIHQTENQFDATVLRHLYLLKQGNVPDDSITTALLAKEKEQQRISLWVWPYYLSILSGRTIEAFERLKDAISKKIGTYANFRHFPFSESIHDLDEFQSISQLPKKSPGTAFSYENVMHKKTLDITPETSFFTLKEAEDYLSLSEKLMTEKQPYLESSLTLRSLAKMLDLHPNRLSWLINKYTGKNFKEYINYFRLEAFKSKALEPSNSHLSLLGIALDSGFNSKSVFNDYFKKVEGITPREWVKQHKI